jgi:hypothetical protein
MSTSTPSWTTSKIRNRFSPVVLCVATMVLGCHDPTATGSVMATLELDRTSIVQGQQIQIFVSATNVGATPLTMTASCALGYRVYASDGALVSPSDEICLLDGRRLTISPGARHVDTLVWYGNRSWGHLPEYVEPGTYSVIGVVSVDGELRSESGERDITVALRD